MNKCIFLLAILLSTSSCVNRIKSDEENINESSKVDIKNYFSTHLYVLIFFIDENKACDICVFQILSRLNYINSNQVQVFIDGLADDSDVTFDFAIFPKHIRHQNDLKPDGSFLCIIDSTFVASHYFLPEMHRPHLLETYLKEISPLICKKK